MLTLGRETSGGSRRRGDFGELVCEPLFRVPQIVGLLHSQPQPGSVTAKLSETEGHFRGYACTAGQNAVQRLARNPQPSSRLAYRYPQSRKCILSKQLARMRRLSVRPRTCQILTGHRHSPSMILLQVNARGIAFRPFEGDAPWAVYMQAVAHWLSLQPMELHPGQMKIRQRTRLIQRVQAPQGSRLQVGPNLGAGAGLK